VPPFRKERIFRSNRGGVGTTTPTHPGRVQLDHKGATAGVFADPLPGMAHGKKGCICGRGCAFRPGWGGSRTFPKRPPGGAVFPPHDPSRIVSPSSPFLCANPHPKRRRSNRCVFRFERELFPIDREVVPVRPSFQPGRDGGRASLPILRSHQIDRIAHTFASSFGAHPTATKDIRSLWKVPKRSR